jgi:hypothetical protein
MTNLPTTQAQNDNFAIAAAHAQSGTISGERLRFVKGFYLLGRGDGERLPAGKKFEAIDIQAAWVKFLDGQVVDQRIGYPMPAREDLDDNDEEDWPLGLDGRPADPWANQRYLYLIDPSTGSDYTFVTSSWGGRAAVEGLARAVSIKRTTVPGAVPIIQLDTVFKRSAKYGNVPTPKFTIIGWNGDDAAPLAEVIDDEIPF